MFEEYKAKQVSNNSKQKLKDPGGRFVEELKKKEFINNYA